MPDHPTDAGARVETLTERIEIGRPKQEVAEELRRIEDHPELFADADEVQLLGEDRYRWTLSVGPFQRDVDAHVTRASDDLLTWRATADGYREAGEVRLVGDGAGRTILHLSASYAIEDTVLGMADAVGLLERRVRRNLTAFRDHLEARRHLDDEPGEQPDDEDGSSLGD
jgi:uncharacterized membrane protein